MSTSERVNAIAHEQERAESLGGVLEFVHWGVCSMLRETPPLAQEQE